MAEVTSTSCLNSEFNRRPTIGECLACSNRSLRRDWNQTIDKDWSQCAYANWKAHAPYRKGAELARASGFDVAPESTPADPAQHLAVIRSYTTKLDDLREHISADSWGSNRRCVKSCMPTRTGRIQQISDRTPTLTNVAA